jgi:hypothetical protein
MAKRSAGSFVDKEKKVLNAVARKIGSTLGQVAALGNTAKKARDAEAKPVRQRRSRPKTVRRIGRAVAGKKRPSARRRK